MYIKSIVSGIILAAFISSEIQAQSFKPDVSFSGFGTLGYAVLDDENAEYRTGEARDGADDSGSFEVDTRLGLQLDAVFTGTLSSAFQGIVRESEDGDPAAELEWGFLRWLPTDNLSIRLGRMSLPVYSNSDFREVGYAQTYLRPPEDVYSQIPLRRFDGIDLTLDTRYGASLFRWQVFAGQAKERIFDGLEPDAEESFGFSVSMENGPFRIRLSRVDTQVDVDSKNEDVAALRNGIAQAVGFVPSLSAIESDFAGQRVPLSFNALALGLDLGRFFADMEFTQRRVDNWVANVDGWSFAVGTRINNIRPYIYASAVSEPDGDRRVVLPDVNPQLVQLQDGINQFYEPRDQSTVGIGMRWDVVPSLAFKAQIDRVSRDETGISFLRTVDDGSDEGEDVTLASFGIDFIF